MNSFSKSDYQSRAFRRSRVAYMLECAFEYFVAILVGDTILPYLLSEIGMPDSLIGVTTSIISLSFLFQLFTVGIARKIKKPKRFGTLVHCLGQLFFLCIYLVPFLPLAEKYKHATVIVCLVVAYFGNYLVSTIIYKWSYNYVEPKKRAGFSAARDIVSLITGMIVSLIIGIVIDAFKSANNPKGAFLFTAISIFVFIACDLVCLLLIKGDSSAQAAAEEESVTMREALSHTLGNKNFRSVILLNVLWNCALYTSIGFLGSYRLKELAFTMTAVQIFTMIGSIIRAGISLPLGRYADRTSYAKSVEIGLLLVALSFAIGVFTTPATRILMLFSMILYSASYAGAYASQTNMTYSYVDKKYFVQASALRGCIGGVCGFLASLGAGKLLDVIQSNGNKIFGISVYGQQVLSLISLIFAIAALLLTKFVIEKQSIVEVTDVTSEQEA